MTASVAWKKIKVRALKIYTCLVLSNENNVRFNLLCVLILFWNTVSMTWKVACFALSARGRKANKPISVKCVWVVL